MPRFAVSKVQDALNERGKSVKGSRILVLGVAYKPDIDDLRESPALDVIHLLQEKGADWCSTTTRTCRAFNHDGWEMQSVPSGPDGRGAGRRRGGDRHQPHKLTITRPSWTHAGLIVDTRNALGDAGQAQPESGEAVMARYLVTGAAGFIASRVCELLLAAGPRGGRHRQPVRRLRRAPQALPPANACWTGRASPSMRWISATRPGLEALVGDRASRSRRSSTWRRAPGCAPRWKTRGCSSTPT